MRKQQRLIEFLFLLNGLVCIFASSCSYTGLPAETKITSGSPKVVMPTKLSGWPSSTPAISMALTVTFDDACSAGQTFHIFSLNLKPSGSDENILDLSIECDTLQIKGTGPYLKSPVTIAGMFGSADLGVLSIAFDIRSDKSFYLEAQTEATQVFTVSSFSFPGSWSFDSLTKINICSGQSGASPRGCTVNNFYLFDDSLSFGFPSAAMATPELYSFYTLLDGSLKSAKGSAGSAYFGDSSSSPSTGTSPKWDSKKEYVEISQEGQFLSFPLPNSFKPTTALTPSSLAVSAWVKITSLPSSEATILALHQADGTQLPVRFFIDQASGAATIYAGGQSIAGPTVSSDTWHLVGFTLSVKKDLKGALGTFFVDSQVKAFSRALLTTSIDLSTASVLRVGGSTSSFTGSVYGVRIITPGGGFIPQSTCSASNALELGLGSFPLLCATDYKLDTVDNTCRKECPSGTQESTSDSVTLCLHSESSESNNGLSAGVIVAIVLGSIAILTVLVLLAKYKGLLSFGNAAAKGKSQGKAYQQAPVSLPVSPLATEGPLAAEAP